MQEYIKITRTNEKNEESQRRIETTIRGKKQFGWVKNYVNQLHVKLINNLPLTSVGFPIHYF